MTTTETTRSVTEALRPYLDDRRPEWSASYVEPVEAGLGATLDQLGPEAARVIVTGSAIGTTARQWGAWVEALGDWVLVDPPYVTGSQLRARVARGGRTVSVTRSAPWFGDAGPHAVSEATKHVRHVVAQGGARMVGSPATTGLAMMRAGWSRRGVEYPPQADEVQTSIRSTSGQGRFELLDRGRQRGGRALLAHDARFAYASIASSIELPIGEPEQLGPGAVLPSYAAAWVEVEVEAPRRLPFGLLPSMVEGARRGWHYPGSGSFVSHCSWAEVELARAEGYRVEVVRGWYWPERARVLRSWADHLRRHRARVLGLPIDDEVAEAVRIALRSVAIQTIGMLHGRDSIAQHVVNSPSEVPIDAVGMRPESGGRWSYQVTRPATWRAADSHPEWSALIWATARQRLARRMLAAKPGQLVAVALDSLILTGEPGPVAVHRQASAGDWRTTRRAGPWEPFGSMADVYAHLRRSGVEA